MEPEKKWKLIFGCLAGVFALLAAYDLVFGGVWSSGVMPASGATSPVATHSGTASPSANRRHGASSSSAASPAQRSLPVTAVAAFGPEGTSDGDNPGIVSRIVNGGAQPWYSSWYASARFGNLQSGTGLLLNMGRSVTVSSVQLVLGGHVGAIVQVRVGDTAALADLSTVGTVTDAGGTVRLPVASGASGRYVLIWFTALPPIGQGRYQASVYSVTVDGTAGT